MRWLGLLLGLTFFISHRLLGQFQLVGSTVQAGTPGCYQITDNIPNQAGAIWSQYQIDLSQSASWEFTFNLGNQQEGGDGLVFVLQAQRSDALGGFDNQLGYMGISPSIGVEFDTGNTSFDHIAVNKDGNIDNASSLNLTGPVPALPSNTSLKDGKDHLVHINWKARTNQLEIFLDCLLRISLKVDLIKDVFSDSSTVWWGITGSTGPGMNVSRQTVCLQSMTRSWTTCPFERVQLSAHQSRDGVYTWTPGTLLDNATIRSPTVTLGTSQLFTVSYQNACGLPVQDSIYIDVRPLPNLVATPSPCLKNGKTHLEVKTQDLNSTYRWFHSGETTANVEVSQPGSYTVQVASSATCTINHVFEVDLCPPQIYVPDVFSPNADGINDYLQLFSEDSLATELTIFNRWGEVVFHSNVSEQSWDGTSRTIACPQGLYTYVLSYCRWNSPIELTYKKKGNILLVR
ncbi:lectin-like domain-containing protein [Larkinella sp. VNQ87]|uniref:lectin-like domain-containing protein n=1 Tax=Larkinella sp. VNQ87 TaxID=3400921 RepID=UPI003C0301FE